MQIRHYTLELFLRHTFRLARGDSDSRRVLVVEIESDGIVGRGEAAPIAHYGQDAESAARAGSSLPVDGKASPPFPGNVATSVFATCREFFAALLRALIDAMLEISLAILILRLRREDWHRRCQSLIYLLLK